MAKKGLTEPEIEIALKSSGAYNVVAAENTSAPLQQLVQHPPPPQLPSKENILNNNQSLVYKIIKFISNIIFAGCVAYTAYKLLIKVLLII